MGREIYMLCEVTVMDDIDNQFCSTKYDIGNNNMKLILMYEHFMPNAIVNKSVVNCRHSQLSITRNIK
jgi:hypothetical protein